MSRHPAMALGLALAALLAAAPLALAAEGGPAPPELQSGVYLAAKAVAALAVVLGLLLVLYWVLRRFAPGQAAGGAGPLKLLGRMPLGARKWLALVEVGGKVLLLGVADHNINLLATIDDQEQVSRISAARPVSFSSLFRGRGEGPGPEKDPE